MRTERWAVIVLFLAALPACQPEDQRTDTIDPAEALQERENLPPEVAMQLDSGSTAFRADDFEGALHHYGNAARLAPEVAAGWFGVYMAELALGHEASAEEALQRARQVVPGATLIHPTPPDTSR